MSSPKKQAQQQLSIQQAAQVLRETAQALEQGQVNLQDLQLDWESISKLELKLRNRQGQIELKTKVKTDSSKNQGQDQQGAEQDPAPAQKKFKPLKKEIAQIFDRIKAKGQQNELPELQDTKYLFSLADEMCHFDATNSKEYTSFRDKTHRLSQAVEDGQPERAEVLIQELAQAEKKCHAKFK
ncbi:MAG: GAK system XXXCH domain-containing protein [Desulfohalobiaceae bacterium]